MRINVNMSFQCPVKRDGIGCLFGAVDAPNESAGLGDRCQDHLIVHCRASIAQLRSKIRFSVPAATRPSLRRAKRGGGTTGQCRGCCCKRANIHHGGDRYSNRVGGSKGRG